MWLSPYDYHCIILDGALPGIKEFWYRYAEHSDSTEYLYLKTPYANLIEVSPLIGRTSFSDPFLIRLYEAVTSKKLRDNWGCLLHTESSPEDLAKHFRRWITIYDDIEEEVFFRFYDPDILPYFISALKGNERQSFFGPINAFMYRKKEQDLLITSEAKRSEPFDQERFFAEHTQQTPWFSLQDRHIKAMRPLFLSHLASEVLTKLIAVAFQWINNMPIDLLRSKVEECLLSLTELNNDTLPEVQEGVIFCALTITSCSHFYESEEFLNAVARNGLRETLDEWRHYTHAPIPGLELWHDPHWLQAETPVETKNTSSEETRDAVIK